MGKRIMVVDDEPDIRITVSTILELDGFEVLAVESGFRCIEELEKGFKGVILMDIMMPGMNGWETIRQIDAKGLLEGNIISMLTAKEDPDSDLEALTETVLDYMRKPFKADELLTSANRYCEWLELANKAKFASA